MWRVKLVGISFVVGLLASSAGAQEPSGDSFEVAGALASHPSVAMAPTGEFLVAWKWLLSHPDDIHGIVGRLFDPEGQPIGAEFLINTYTTGGQEDPHITVDGEGRFIVVWDSNTPGDIRGRLISAAGQPQGSDFIVNSVTSVTPRSTPRVSATDLGDFVVVWDSDGVGGDPNGTVQGRRFSSNAVPLAAQFTVNTVATAYSQERPDVGVNPSNGDFTVVWESTEAGLSNDDIRVGRFSSSGLPVGSELIANTYTPFFQQWPRVEMDAEGGFVVTWNGPTTGDDQGIVMRRFQSDATPATGELLINSYTTGLQELSDMSMTADGSVVVSWQSEGSNLDSDQEGILGLTFDSSGASDFDFQINNITAGSQIEPESAWDHRGRFVTVWESEDTIHARLYDTSIELEIAEPVMDTVTGLRSLGSWKDYRFQVPSGAGDLFVSLSGLPTDPPNDADLYVRRGARSTSALFDCRSNAGGNASESCSISNPIPGVWWISVANWSTGSIDFTIEASASPDLSLLFYDSFESGDTSAW